MKMSFAIVESNPETFKVREKLKRILDLERVQRIVFVNFVLFAGCSRTQLNAGRNRNAKTKKAMCSLLLHQ